MYSGIHLFLNHLNPLKCCPGGVIDCGIRIVLYLLNNIIWYNFLVVNAYPSKFPVLRVSVLFKIKIDSNVGA